MKAVSHRRSHITRRQASRLSLNVRGIDVDDITSAKILRRIEFHTRAFLPLYAYCGMPFQIVRSSDSDADSLAPEGPHRIGILANSATSACLDH